MKTTVFCLILALVITCFGYADIIHVSGDYPITIQEAIDAAVDGDTVLVADGIWTGDGNKNLDFKGKAITVKSENGAENCIIDCQGDGRGFYFHSGEGENSVVEGFTITNGFAADGGGIYNDHSSPTVTNCTFANNYAGSVGGGMYNYRSSSPTVTNCTFTSNYAYEASGMLNNSSSSPTVTNCTFTSNTADINGGGMINLDSSSPTVTNCTFTSNTANINGGGIYNYLSSSPTVTNCTFASNYAYKGGGMYNTSSSPTVTNCIFWGDSVGEIYNSGISAIVTYCDVQGGYTGTGNIDADPMFVDPDNGDFHLQAGSPCIDAGTPIGAPPDDIEGNPRDEFPEMGAYEYQGVSTGSIYGTVTDITGKPISKAIVIALNAETKEKYPAPFTGNTGDYEIPDLPAGIYWVLCIKKGYKAGIKKAEVLAGEVTTVDFILTPKLE